MSNEASGSESFLSSNPGYFDRIQQIGKIGLWKYDLETGKMLGTPEAAGIYGLEFSSVSLEKIRSIALPEFRESLKKEMRGLIKGTSDYDIEFRIRREDNGEIRTIHSIAEFDVSERQITGIIQDITERVQMESALAESEKRFRSLFENSVSGIIFVASDGSILEINKRMLTMLGSPSISETKKINMLTFPLLVEVGFSDDLRKAIETGESVFNSTNYKSKWGVTIYLEYYLTPISSGGRLIGVMGKLEDITARKTAEMKVEALLNEKDLMVREVHHRIKNNMASMEGLLRLQIDNTDNPEVKTGLKEAVSRLGSMRILYEKLYQSGDFMETETGPYLSRLIDEIISVFPEGDEVVIEKNIDNFAVPTDKIFVLGIIMNELLTNCMKYAFNDKTDDKRIFISAVKSGKCVSIKIHDNGPGYPEADPLSSGGFGLRLIKMLSEQIGGNALFKNEDGAVFTLNFDV